MYTMRVFMHMRHVYSAINTTVNVELLRMPCHWFTHYCTVVWYVFLRTMQICHIHNVD